MTRKKDHWISVRVSEEENRIIEEKMKQCGIRNKGAYMRKMAMDGYCLNLQFEEIKKLLHLLGKCGNNLNQYAKKANCYGDVYRQDMKELKGQFSEMQAFMKKVLAKMLEIQ